MKKILALVLAAMMVLSMAACAPANDDNETTAGTTAAQVAVPASALEILENIWADYAEEEKFSVIGGNVEDYVDGAPGNYDMAYAENLTYNLLVPAEQLANIDEAASMVHGMMSNNFTSGVLHVIEGVEATAFADTLYAAVQNNQWMCGMPDKVIVAVIGGEYVLMAFGIGDAMTPFQTHLSVAYPDAEILYNEAIAG